MARLGAGFFSTIAVSAALLATLVVAQEKPHGGAGADVAASGSFTSDGLAIHYESVGKGRPLVLVHGWGVGAKRNWVDTGFVKALKPVRRVITIDCRGHGRSDKPH